MRFDDIPIWGLFATTSIIVLLAIEAGYLLGRAAHRRTDDEKESPVSAMAGAVLGLAAFMLAFTFGIVWERYDARKALVREDAAAIRTAWERSDFLPESDRIEAKALLREYVDVRVNFVHAQSLAPEHVKRTLDQTRRIQQRLWEMAVTNARTDMDSDVAAMYIDSLNEMNTIHASRVALGIQARIPREIWFVLCCITILGMAGVGYQTGIAGSTRSKARPFLVFSFGLAVALIASLDRPDSGRLQINQQPLLDVREVMAPR